jgi:hypothetical protein
MNVDPEGATWRKSTYSNGSGGNCVEVADLPNGRAVRDSKHPQGPILVFATDQWRAFVQGIKAGIPALGLPATGSDEPARHRPPGASAATGRHDGNARLVRHDPFRLSASNSPVVENLSSGQHLLKRSEATLGTH